MSKNSFWAIIALIIIVVGGYFAISKNLFNTSPTPSATSTVATSTSPVINAVSYSCEDGKSIGAAFTQTSVALSLSDGRSLNLPQTVSGSGIRYEMTATSTQAPTSTDIVFWSEGNNAFITENASSTYQDCLAGTVTKGQNSNSFTDASKTFSFSYPTDLSVTGAGVGYTQDWMTNATTSGMILAQVKIPKTYLPGTNFGDAKFTVGTSADASAVSTCLTYNPAGGRASTSTTVTLGGATFTVLHSSDAGAGNYYDTTSYRISRSSQCYAIEYTIHYSNFQNYPKGAVKQFDEAALATKLDAIARSFAFSQ